MEEDVIRDEIEMMENRCSRHHTLGQSVDF